MKRIILSLLVYSLSLLSVAQQSINYTITVESVQREFILYVPASYDGNSSTPLILSYHGLGGTAQAQMDDHDFRPLADAEGFLIAHPEGAPINAAGLQGWNFVNDTLPNDVLFTSAMIDSIAADYNINPDRVYACGMSFGGFFSVFLAGQLSNRIAAVASVAGTMVNAVPYSMLSPERPISLLQIHGTNDFNVPYNGGMASQPVQSILDHFVSHNNCDTNFTVTQVPDVDPNDGSTVEHFVYANGDEETVVEHFRITGGRHTWPDENTNAQGVNRDINGCAEIWKFFSRFDMNGALDITTVVEPVENFSAIKIYPNPAQNTILLQAGAAVREFRIFDVTGQEYLLPIVSLNPTMEVDISTLPSGLYFISGKTESSMFQSSFVKL